MGGQWNRTVSNRRPPRCQRGALPAELRPRGGGRRAHGCPTDDCSESPWRDLNSRHPVPKTGALIQLSYRGMATRAGFDPATFRSTGGRAPNCANGPWLWVAGLRLPPGRTRCGRDSTPTGAPPAHHPTQGTSHRLAGGTRTPDLLVPNQARCQAPPLLVAGVFTAHPKAASIEPREGVEPSPIPPSQGGALSTELPGH